MTLRCSKWSQDDIALFKSGTLVNNFNYSGLALPLAERSEGCATSGFHLWTTIPESVRLDRPIR